MPQQSSFEEMLGIKGAKKKEETPIEGMVPQKEVAIEDMLPSLAPKVNPMFDFYRTQLQSFLASQKAKEAEERRVSREPTPYFPSVQGARADEPPKSRFAVASGVAGVPRAAPMYLPQEPRKTVEEPEMGPPVPPSRQPLTIGPAKESEIAWPEPEPEKPHPIFTPLLNIAKFERQRLEEERRTGRRLIVGPGGPIELSPSGDIESGIRMGTANIMDSIASPLGLGVIASAPLMGVVGFIAPALKIAIDAGFTYWMASGFVRAIPGAVDAYKDKNWEEFSRLATEGVAQGALIYLMSKGLVNEARILHQWIRQRMMRLRPEPAGPVEELGPRVTEPPPTPPELEPMPAEVAVRKAENRIVEAEKVQAAAESKAVAERIKAIEPPVQADKVIPAVPVRPQPSAKEVERGKEALEKILEPETEELPDRLKRVAEPAKELTPEEQAARIADMKKTVGRMEPEAPENYSVEYRFQPSEAQKIGNRYRVYEMTDDLLARYFPTTKPEKMYEIHKDPVVVLMSKDGGSTWEGERIRSRDYVDDYFRSRDKWITEKVRPETAVTPEERKAVVPPKTVYRVGKVPSARDWEYGSGVTYFGASREVASQYGKEVKPHRLPADTKLMPTVYNDSLAKGEASRIASEEGVAIHDGVNVYLPDGGVYRDAEIFNRLRELGYDGIAEVSSLGQARQGDFSKANIAVRSDLLGGTVVHEAVAEFVEKFNDLTDITETESPNFRTSKEATDIRTASYARSKSWAANMDELYRQLPDRPMKDSAITTHKLTNDVNRWLDGDDIDIEATRDFLSELAANAEKFRPQFIGEDYPTSFFEWERTVKAAAIWARNARRGEGEPKGGVTPSLYSGLDPWEAAKVVGNWYSMLRKVAEEKIPKRASASQVANTLRKRVTKDEWETSQLEGFLKGKDKVTRDEVLAHIDRMVPEFKDVMLSGQDVEELGAQLDEAVAAGRPWEAPGIVKYEQYTEKGPKSDYRELFVTVPGRPPREVESAVYPDQEYPFWRVEGHRLPYPDRESALGAAGQTRGIGKPMVKWRDGHPDYSEIENPIVRLRFDTRTDTEGNKVLFIEEMQPPNPENFDKMPPEFQRRWREIGMKRAIKYALDNGFSKVAWTTGEMQLERYGIPDTISYLEYGKNPDGTYYLMTPENMGLDIPSVRDSELETYVDVDTAERIRRNEGRFVGSTVLPTGESVETYALSVEGMNVGKKMGGLKRLYNQDMPNVAKKLGGKVGDTKIALGKTELSTVPSIDLSSFARGGWTPTMYSGIDPTLLKGLFSSARRASRVSDEAELQRKANAKKVRSDLKRQATRKWIHQGGNARRALELYGDEGAKLIQAQALGRGGVPSAKNLHRQALAEINRGLDHDDKRILKRLILHTRLIEIAKSPAGAKLKYFEDHPVSESVAFVQHFQYEKANGIKDLSPKKTERLKKAADTYFSWAKKAPERLYKGGLIGEQELKWLSEYKYQRLQLADPSIAALFDKRRTEIIGGRKKGVYDSGVEVLRGGKNTDIFEDDYELLLLELFTRVENRTKRNEAKSILQDLARRIPDNPFVRTREREVEDVRGEQPKSKKGLSESIEIKRLGKGISDYELRTMIKDMFNRGIGTKVSAARVANKLSIEQLRQLDKVLGPVSMKYVGSLPIIPPGWKRDFLYENGARKTVWLEPEFANEWMTQYTEITNWMAKFFRYASGSFVLKPMATGINPVFAFRNAPRDLSHAWFASRIFEDGKWESVYSSFMPKFAGQIGKDYVDIFSDALLREGSYNDYVEDGGGMDLLTHQGRPFSKTLGLDRPIDKIVNFLGYLNETSEIATRLAIRQRVIKREARKKGITVEEASKDPEIRKKATFTAYDQMAFPEGGSGSKALDNIFPYLNARIVATRSFWRSFRPGSGTASQSWLKLAQFAAIVSGIYLWNKYRSPKTMAELKGDPRAGTNLVIPLGDDLAITDRDGNTRYPFFIIPIDSAQQFFKAFFEASTDWWEGEDVDWSTVVKSIGAASPADVSTLPPTAEAFYGYARNIDFWADRPVWGKTDTAFGWQPPKVLTGAEVGGSEEEYIPGVTPQLLVDIGAATGLSPERAKYFLEQLITHNSPYAQLLGGAYEHMFGELPKDQREETLAEAFIRTITSMPVISSFFRLTYPGAKHGEDIAAGKEESEIINWVENRGLDAVVRGYIYHDNRTRSDVMDYVNVNPITGDIREKDVRDRLLDRFEFHERIKDLPSKGFWLGLKSITSPRGRAKTYVDILSKVEPGERETILREELTVRGIDASGVPNFRIFSDEFVREVGRIQLNLRKAP